MDDSYDNFNTDDYRQTLFVTHRLSYKPYSGRNRATLLRPFFHLYETCLNIAFLNQRVIWTCANKNPTPYATGFEEAFTRVSSATFAATFGDGHWKRRARRPYYRITNEQCGRFEIR
jgi:hypothetical protein